MSTDQEADSKNSNGQRSSCPLSREGRYNRLLDPEWQELCRRGYEENRRRQGLPLKMTDGEIARAVEVLRHNPLGKVFEEPQEGMSRQG